MTSATSKCVLPSTRTLHCPCVCVNQEICLRFSKVGVSICSRRRTVWPAVQEQPLSTDLGGLPGDGGPLCGLLLDLPQHPGRRPRGLQQQHGEEPLLDAQVTAG